jgi:hypothetical protein
MLKKLINPFVYIAGTRSLLWGIKIILITSVFGYFLNIHFPDVISVKIGPDFPFLYHIIQSFSNWIILSVILYLISIFFSKSKIRIIDVLGTQALARFPYLIAPFTGIPKSPQVFSQYILYEYLGTGDPIAITTQDIIVTIIIILFTIFLTIWMIALMYNAFKVSTNMKGSKSVIIFIVGLVVSIVITTLITSQLIQIFS